MNPKEIIYKPIDPCILELFKREENVLHMRCIDILDSAQVLQLHRFPTKNSEKTRHQL